MARLRVSIHDQGASRNKVVEFDALDIPTALTIADINVGNGGAEIWDGTRLLARLSKHGGSHATFWQVS